MSDQFDPMYFRRTLETLKAGTLATLMDYIDSGWPMFSIPDMSRRALEDCGIVRPFMDAFTDYSKTGMHSYIMNTLTPYGEAFVAWYRAGQDLPTQMSLFED